ncbi:MAG TPA: hypothetical protein VFM61_08620 [Pseudidiomarina sp.]|nr:hypothetical protein [Pseudidiomarina sp.]
MLPNNNVKTPAIAGVFIAAVTLQMAAMQNFVEAYSKSPEQ